MADLRGLNLTFVETFEELQSFMRWVPERRPVLGLDTETRGFDYWNHMGKFARLVQFGDAKHGWALSVDRWRGAIDEVLSTYDRSIAGSNIKFDINALRATGFTLPKEHLLNDTMLADQIINPLRRHGLKEMAAADLHADAGAGQHLLKVTFKNGGWNWNTVPEHALAYGLYSAADPSLSAMEWEHIEPLLGSQREAYELEMAYSLICADMEYRGLRIDKSYLGRLQDRWMNDIGDLKERLLERGIEKPNSRLQVITSLEREGWVPMAFTATGAPAVDKTVLEALKVDYDTAQELLEYRNMTKRMANYTTKMLSGADSNDHIHPSFKVMGARTGRSSITNPPLQQLPKAYEVRRGIIPDEGQKLWAIDYAAEEFYLMISQSKDPVALELIESGADVHRWIASQAYHTAYEDISKDSKERQRSKNTLYASLYNAQAAKVAATAGIEEHEAEMILQVINSGFAQMDAWRTQITNDADMMAEPAVLVGDRTIPLPFGRTYTTAVNTIIQGLGAQVLKRAMVRVKAAGLDHHILTTVHDEAIYQLPDDADAPLIAAELSDIMKDISFRPNLITEVTGPLDSWGAAYPRKDTDVD